MQMMGDSISVLGSRIGITWDPNNRLCYLIRHGRHPGIPLNIEAGVEVDGRIFVLPLTKEYDKFDFIDQGMSATTMTMGGIEPELGIHVKLTVRIPFKPRDSRFSTVPVIYFELEVERMASNFRWTNQTEKSVSGKLFLQLSGEGFNVSPKDNDLNINYKSNFTSFTADDIAMENYIECEDKLVVINGELNGTRIEQSFDFIKKDMKGISISAAWCVYDKPILNVLGDIASFKYTEMFNNIEAVAKWARENIEIVRNNSKKVDKIIHASNLGESINHLLAQTLHAWLMNTWFVVRPNGQDWFTVWEGSCYFQSTVDVEYTQGPFYLTLWPELLELELNEWSLYGKDGKQCIGEKGENTLFLSHDMGLFADCSKQRYPHDMEVEENSNYIILAYCHWRRTNNDSVIKNCAHFIKKLTDFILACDTTGNGIPDKGCANTIDDASPAVQFGSEQIYLGVKAMAACQVSKIMLKNAGYTELNKYDEFVENAKHTIESSGYKDDHYIVTLTKTLDGLVDPWTGEVKNGELEGWDAHHIYTENGLALLDMLGFKTGLDENKLYKDIESSVPLTLGKYGCRHSSFEPKNFGGRTLEGFVGTSSKTGWISMNILRDIAAAYRGMDLLSLSDRYWDWQLTTNTQKVSSFFETFYGNCLNFYPRGVAVYGYLDAAVGFAYDEVDRKKSFSPIRASIKVPLLLFADWERGMVPMISTKLVEGCLEYTEEVYYAQL